MGWLAEALKGADWHEAQREKCAKIGLIGLRRACRHSKMYHGILYAHALATEFREMEPKYVKEIRELKKELEETKRALEFFRERLRKDNWEKQTGVKDGGLF